MTLTPNLLAVFVILMAFVSIILSAVALDRVDNKTQHVSGVTSDATTFQGSVIANSLGSREKLLIPELSNLGHSIIWDIQATQTARVVITDHTDLSLRNLIDGFSATLTATFENSYQGTEIVFNDSNLAFSSDSASFVSQTSLVRVQITNGFAIVQIVPIPTILGLGPTLWYSVRSPDYYTLNSDGTLATLRPLGTHNFTLTHNGDDITLVPMGSSTGMTMGSTSQLIVSSVPVDAIRTGARATTWICVGQNIPQENNSLVFWDAGDVSVHLYTNLDDPILEGLNFDLTDLADPSGVGTSPPFWERSFQVCVSTAGNDGWLRLYMNNNLLEQFDGGFTTLNGGPGNFIIGQTPALAAPHGIVGDVIVFNRELTATERLNVVHELGRLYGFPLLPLY